MFKRKNLVILTGIFLLNIFGRGLADRRPFYIIAHMVNSLRQVTHYLDRGANALESDIQFHPDGSVKEAYHGFPCDCFRTCHRSAKLSDYLQHVREITEPDIPGSYYNRMLLQFFDLKLNTSNNKTASGRDIARHVLNHLWSKDAKREQEVRVILYFNDVTESDVVLGFIAEFKDRGEEARLKDVGFDGGMGDIGSIRNKFIEMGINKNVWQGDGVTNCISPVASDSRLRRAVRVRNSKLNYMSKVYHWTIDLKLRMRLSLNLGVDAIITNDPEDLREVLQESYYVSDFRVATIDDDPFVRYEG